MPPTPPMPSPRVNGPQPPAMAASGRTPAAPPPPMGGPSERPQPGAEDGPGLAAAIQAEIPEPKDEGYNPKLLADVEAALREAWEAVREMAPSLPELPPKLLPDGFDGMGPLPPSLIVPAVLLLRLIADAPGDIGKRYAIDVGKLVDDAAVRRELLSRLNVLASDKKIAKALGGPPEKEAKPEPAGKEMKEPPPVPKGVAAGL